MPANALLVARKEQSKMSDAAGNTRVVFYFDDGSIRVLEEMTKALNFGSQAETVRQALRVVRALQMQAETAYSDVIVQNPDTGDQKKLVVPFLDRLNPNRHDP
jgi:hypothetical protein